MSITRPRRDETSLRLRRVASLLATCDIQVEGRHFIKPRIGPEQLGRRAAAVKATARVGAAAQARRVEDDRLGERLWNGISRVRVNLGTAIVGTPQQAADELSAYWRMGFDEFILSAYPHLEEAERVAHEVLPLVEAGTTMHAEEA